MNKNPEYICYGWFFRRYSTGKEINKCLSTVWQWFAPSLFRRLPLYHNSFLSSKLCSFFPYEINMPRCLIKSMTRYRKNNNSSEGKTRFLPYLSAGYSVPGIDSEILAWLWKKNSIQLRFVIVEKMNYIIFKYSSVHVSADLFSPWY